MQNKLIKPILSILLIGGIGVLTVLGCASAPPAEPPPAFQCPAGEFQSSGFGETESEALNMARAEIAKQINLSMRVTVESAVSQRMIGGEESLSSDYVSKTVMESALFNAHDARAGNMERSGNRINITLCMSRADAAKGFLEKQRLLSDSLELIFNAALETKHPKHKNDAWQRTQMLWNELARIQSLLKGWGVAREDYINSAGETYSKAKEDYKGYCQSAKLHWNPERENEYSEIAFSKLSSGIKMEKSPCSNNGISIVYKGTEPECVFKYGVSSCYYKPSLSLSSCEGIEYLRLGGEAMGAHKKLELAIEKLQGNLKSAEFLNKWMQEIKEWSPLCE